MHISPVHIVYIVRNVHHPHLHGSLWMTRLEPHAEDGCDQCGCGVRVKYGRNIHINWHELVSFCHCLSSMQVLISEYSVYTWHSSHVCVCVQSPNVSPSTKAQLKPIHLSARLFVVPRIKGSSICHFSTEGVGMLQKLSWSTDWKGSKTWEIASLPDMLHMYGCHFGVYWFSVCVCGHERYTYVERIFAMPLLGDLHHCSWVIDSDRCKFHRPCTSALHHRQTIINITSKHANSWIAWRFT